MFNNSNKNNTTNFSKGLITQQRDRKYFDLETTGLEEACQILEYAECNVKISGHNYYKEILAKPDIFALITPGALKTTGKNFNSIFKNNFSHESQYSLAEIINSIWSITSYTNIIAHNGKYFDIPRLRSLLKKNLFNPFVDATNHNLIMDTRDAIAFINHINPSFKITSFKNKLCTTKLEDIFCLNVDPTAKQSHKALDDVMNTEILHSLMLKDERFKKAENYYSTPYKNNQEYVLNNNSAFYIKKIYKMGNLSLFGIPLQKHKHWSNFYLYLSFDIKDLKRLSFQNLDKYIKKDKIRHLKLNQLNYIIHSNTGLWQKEFNKIDQSFLSELKNKIIQHPKTTEYLNDYYNEINKTKDNNIQVCSDILDMRVYKFMTYEDKIIASKFHRALPDEKIKLAESFEHSEYKELAYTILFNNFRGQLSSNLYEELLEKEYTKNLENKCDCRPKFNDVIEDCKKIALEEPKLKEDMENYKTF
ncbi:exonuclease domain-containing protein, partial [Alphaproteobacteria bacterium]|nr:exonuclease domain-containing protein [Alphaproteobacteria bacterium]